jgi:hypothetical protein
MSVCPSISRNGVTFIGRGFLIQIWNYFRYSYVLIDFVGFCSSDFYVLCEVDAGVEESIDDL